MIICTEALQMSRQKEFSKSNDICISTFYGGYVRIQKSIKSLQYVNYGIIKKGNINYLFLK